MTAQDPAVAADAEFRHPRLAAIYDALDPDRADLEVYAGIAAELGARRVLDVGCGTGTFALLLAGRGYDVIGADPAAASLAVARAKPGAGQVRWVDGDASAVTVTDRDAAFMTGNVAQAITDPAAWHAALRAVHAALRPGGYLVFETRVPAARGWREWNRDATWEQVAIPDAGLVTTWTELTDISWPLVSFRTHYRFAADGMALASESTLRFRERAEVEADARATGFTVTAVRGAPDRPGREWVFICQRAAA